jgi:hypothetical protein
MINTDDELLAGNIIFCPNMLKRDVKKMSKLILILESMAKTSSPPNAPSKTGNPSGPGRGNNPPKSK